MDYNSIIYEKKSSIAKITLNKPDAGNTLDLQLAKELYSASLNAASDDNIKALILTANGKLFCGGGNLKFLLSNKKEVKKILLEMTMYFHGAISRMARMNAPVIVGVNGTAGGGGFSLAITGDIIYAVKDAKFTLAYTNAGLSPDGSSTYYLPRIVGMKKAKELMLTNRLFSAEEAHDMGLIDLVFNSNIELNEAINKQAEVFSKGPINAYKSVKKLLSESFNNGLESQMEAESIHISNNAESKDGIEGITAFSEKRKPNFNE
ncbi:MAG: 4-chlorobenzoyl coenzyme A dehalogenase-2 [Alphaproteobacteria bacterium MarineAlpha9_Bin4]|nr:enoyl-CoA hydratase [Pelagibacterales bacterium]PPR24810.1 MAG: 4-chlorobenzoyl coenzyme A dehalogenase-2 [Alphaproteobacteria bacterium MarineAlpha9_Bin4]